MRCLGGFDWNKNVVMVCSGNDIAADACVSKRAGECCREADSVKIGVNLECDPRGAKKNREFQARGFCFGCDECDPLHLPERRDDRYRAQIGFMGN